MIVFNHNYIKPKIVFLALGCLGAILWLLVILYKTPTEFCYNLEYDKQTLTIHSSEKCDKYSRLRGMILHSFQDCKKYHLEPFNYHWEDVAAHSDLVEFCLFCMNADNIAEFNKQLSDYTN